MNKNQYSDLYEKFFNRNILKVDNILWITMCIYSIIFIIIDISNIFFTNKNDQRLDVLTQVIFVLSISFSSITILLGLIKKNKHKVWYKFLALAVLLFFSFSVSSVSMKEVIHIVALPIFIIFFYLNEKLFFIYDLLSIFIYLFGRRVYDLFYYEMDYGYKPINYNLLSVSFIIEIIDIGVVLLVGVVGVFLIKEIKKSLNEHFINQNEIIEMNKEMMYANEIQKNMLNSVFPVEKEYEIYASNISAKQVGGDFYDFFKIDRKHIAIIIADVSGKGLQAALYMALTKALIKVYALDGNTTDKILEKTNNYLVASKKNRLFVTVWIGILNLEDGLLSYTDAGHNFPILYNNDGKCEFLSSEINFVVGGKANIKYYENKYKLQPGSKLFLYTDGVTEAKSKKDKFYTVKRLLDEINKNRNKNVKEIVIYINDVIKEFENGIDQYDDITMLAFEYKSFMLKPIINKKVFTTNIKDFDKALLYIKEECSKIHNKESFLRDIEISCSEVIANISSYAYDGKEGNYSISIMNENNSCNIIFEDEGIEFNPLNNKNPDITLKLNERLTGGIGIYLVKKLMNDVFYKYENKKNILILKKVF